MSENIEMDRRLELHEKLCNLLGSNKRVYFQPPESLKMKFPCIVYSRIGRNPIFADNEMYSQKTQYQVVVVDEDPDSIIPSKIQKEFKYCSPGKPYTSDNLNHDPFTIYY